MKNNKIDLQKKKKTDFDCKNCNNNRGLVKS